MSKARDMAEILSTPPAIYSTDAEVAATYLTQSSASSAYLTRSSASTIYEGSPYRNLVINGAMQVAQRGTSVTGYTNAAAPQTVDRFRPYVANSIGTWTNTQEVDAPSGSGFRNSWKWLCTTANTTLDAADLFYVGQAIEGQNLQQVKKGTAAAEQLTVSFWVKSNVTGTYVCSLFDIDNNRITGKSYTISASATWEKKTITFAADTTGVFDNDNAESLRLLWGLAAGSTYTTGALDNTWATLTNANFLAGQVNVSSATNNYWQITGVQLEVGDTATPFEFKPFAQDLLECQRYYQVIVSGSNIIFGGGFYYTATEADMPTTFITEMRTAPTGSVVSGTDYYGADNGSAGDYFNTMTLQKANTRGCNFYSGTGTSGTAFRPCYFISNNAASFIAVQAEL